MQHLIIDLGFSIGMFMVALIGLRFTVLNCFGIDILDFSTSTAKMVAGIAGSLVLLSIYQLITDPRRIHRLGKKLTQ